MLASGRHPDQDVYTLSATVDGPIAAFRLEALPHDSLPAGGPGRQRNFILTDFRVTVGESNVRWSRASADYSQLFPADQRQHHPVERAIDDDPNTGWAIFPRYGVMHWALFVPKQRIESKGKVPLTIRLAFQNQDWKGQSLGRFRLSVTDKLSDAQPQESNAPLQEALPPHARLALYYLEQNEPRRAADLLTKATAANPKMPAADWLTLAQTQLRLGEQDQARKSCLKAAQRLAPLKANSNLRPLLRRVLLAVNPDSREGTALVRALAGAPPELLTEAIRKDPQKAKGYQDRAEWYGQRGLWKEARADLSKAFQLEPNVHRAMQLGFVLVQLGEVDAYREHCRAALGRFGSTTNNSEADQLLKTCLLHSESKVDAKQLAHLAEVVAATDKTQAWYEWIIFAKALYEYRMGQYAAAASTAREILQLAPQTNGNVPVLRALGFTVEAMALYRSGEEGGAKKSLMKAKRDLERHMPGIDGNWWHDGLAAHILYREAQKMIAAKKVESKE